MSRFGSLFLNRSDSPDPKDSPEPKGSPEPEAPEPQALVPYELLFIDDEANVLSALKRVFRQENYRIRTAQDARTALQMLAEQPCHLLITDYKMPGMSGADLLREVRQNYPDTIRILLTGQADTDAVMAAIKEGAVYKFILKPWNDDDLRVTVALGLEQYELRRENAQLKEGQEKQSKELSMLARLAVTHRSQLAIMLNKQGLLSDQQVQKLYQLLQSKKANTFQTIVGQGWLTEERIHQVLVKEFLFERIDLNEFQINAAVAALLPASLCRKQKIVPLKQAGRRLMIAMTDPMDAGLTDELKFTIGMEIDPVLATTKAIEDKIREVYGDSASSFKSLETAFGGSEPMDQIEVVLDEDDDVGIEELLQGTDEPPAIRLVNAIIIEAVRLQVSDIHIQPRTNDVVTRFRIDGVLHDKLHIPASMLMPLVSRIKVMAEMDITERRRPQDGRITVKTPLRVVDLRISTLPTVNGEKVVMRILDRSGSIQRLDALGFEDALRRKIDYIVRKPQGIILATGPTGSGKTTTLYAMLQHVASPEKNYITVEDPVEYFFEAAGQVMIREKVGLNFATVLRAILRQDPDVLLIGEIRDFETAEVAFHAALTGHLVFSTLHTNSTMDTLARLFDLGLKPYVVASAIEAIIAQRLVRKNCTHCREEEQPPADLLHSLGPLFAGPDMRFMRGIGCDRCQGSGMSGRTALYEVLIPSELMKHGIASGTSILKLKQMAQKDGLTLLIDDAVQKVRYGEVPISEIFRVLGPQVV